MADYFELYKLPQSFHPDPALVKAKYYELSRTYHPDRFAQADAHEKAETLRMAAMNNDAYKTLSDADRCMAYILKLHGVLEDEEKYALPPEFLMEMMELNEAVSEYELEAKEGFPGGNTEPLSLDPYLKEWQQAIAPLTRQFDEGENNPKLLPQIKDYYFRKKYLLRIQERIDTFAAR